MADYVTTTTLTGTCSCCAGTTPCSCALLIPPLGSPYAAITDAQAVIAKTNNYEWADCLGYIYSNYDPSDTISSFTDTFDGTTLVLNGAVAGLQFDMWASVSLLASAVVSVAYTKNSGGGKAQLYSCDGTLIESLTSTNTTDTLAFSAVASDGEYFLRVYCEDGGLLGTTMDSSTTVSSTFWVNPVIALWDDSGTTRSLWACPKLLLPPLTESTGDWYASCADANTALTTSTASGTVSNCVGYDAVNSTLQSAFSFTATDSSTSLDFSHSATGAASGGPASTTRTMLAWGGFNASAGDVITVAWSCSGAMGTGFNGVATLYDDAGVFIETIGNTTGASASFSALPYTGRYTIKVVIQPDVVIDNRADFAASASISSSGSFSVNPIQARYDLGLTCSGNLDCGDACP